MRRVSVFILKQECVTFFSYVNGLNYGLETFKTLVSNPQKIYNPIEQSSFLLGRPGNRLI